MSLRNLRQRVAEPMTTDGESNPKQLYSRYYVLHGELVKS
jgi:hypothetical protein